MTERQPKAMTLLELNTLIAGLVQVPETTDVWVTAEISDFGVRGGHCYMDLVQKSADGERTVARQRAMIWANSYYGIDARFREATGRPLGQGIKVMFLVSATVHPVYGTALKVTDVNPEFTLGDMMARRREMIARLTEMGIIGMNRELEWPVPANRIAVISSPGAAGYGDFMHQLFSNQPRLRFTVKLFEAVMQGQRAARSIISALDSVSADIDSWDAVVIIRGGGASDDLACFDDFELAECIAQFPVPVIIGIGHERDVTLLDYVANVRVKTPTAAAELLINRGEELLNRLTALGTEISRTAAETVGGYANMLDRAESLLPVLAMRNLEQNGQRLTAATSAIQTALTGRLSHAAATLDAMESVLRSEPLRAVDDARRRIDSAASLVDAYSPQSVLRRGFSLTLDSRGRAVRSAKDVSEGDSVVTLLASGSIKSKIYKTTESDESDK